VGGKYAQIMELESWSAAANVMLKLQSPAFPQYLPLNAHLFGVLRQIQTAINR